MEHFEAASSSLLQNPAAEYDVEEEEKPRARRSSSTRQGRHGSWLSSSRTQSVSGHYHFDLDKERKRCKKLFHDRVPKGKAPFIVFLINFLESFAFYGALSFVRFTVFHGSSNSDFAFTIFYLTAGRLFYPVAGLIADVYLGRYRVIHIGLWLLWVGFAIIVMGMACEWQYPNLVPVQKLPGIVATIFFMLGSASVESTIIPFGVDQIQQGATSEELSSYFSWYLFGRNAGYVANILCLIGISNLQNAVNGWLSLSDIITGQTGTSCGLDCPYYNNATEDQLSNMENVITKAASGLVILVAVTVAIFLLFCNQHLFFKARQRENPLRNIINVVYFAATVKRQPPQYRRSFRYGEGKKARIELAKVEFDGIYSSEEVEDVKTFFRVLFLTLSLGFTFTTFGALNAMYNHTTAQKAGFPTYFSLVDSGSLLVLIPVFNHLLLPCTPGVSMKTRMGVGTLLFVLSTAVGTLVHWMVQEGKISSQHLELFWLTTPVLMLVLGIMFVFISGLEFIYAQSPDSMKGLLTGLYYFIIGAFSGVGSLIFYTTLLPGIWFFYPTILAMSAMGLFFYALMTLCYRNRKRPTNDESEKEIQRRSIATNVYLTHHHEDSNDYYT